ncbi:MAG: methyl-accepting chemotaxis protein [Treponema sp.]|nr:methyl-accepting chemotaxis protein [Treponema sp.]
MKLKQYSLTTVLSGMFFVELTAVAVLVSLLLFLPLRAITYRNVERNISENITAVKNQIIAKLYNHTSLLDHTIIGAIPYMREATVDRDGLSRYFDDMHATLANVMMIYATNNLRWNDAGGYCAASNQWIPNESWNNLVRSWYMDAKQANGTIIFTDPYIDAATGELIFAMAKTVFDKDGRDLGVVSENVSIETLGTLVNAHKAIPEMQTWVLHDSGRYITNADESAVMQTDFFTDQGLEDFRSSILAESPFSVNQGTYLIYSDVIPLADWRIVSLLPTKAVFSEVNLIVRNSVLLSIIGIVVFLVIMFFSVRAMLKPITSLSLRLKDISEGEGDLTKTISIAAHNEIGDLAHYFNRTLEKIKTMVLVIKEQTEALSRTGTALAGNMTQTAASINHITSHIQNINSQTENQQASVKGANAIMEQVVENFDTLTGEIQKQTNWVAQSSAAIEQLLANIQQVSQTLIKNGDNITSLAESSERGRNGLREVSVDIQTIARESEGLLEINAVMENIASQTNLLSMNAAIEAAHAGEAGKGFAVVADEIRKLAESSGEQSKTIASVLKRIKESIDTIAVSTDKVINQFEVIDRNVKTVSEQESHIRNAMTEQGRGSQQVLECIKNLNEITRNIEDDSVKMRTNSQEIIVKGKNLDILTQEIRQGMEEMAGGAEGINTAVQQVNEISGENKRYIDALTEEVSKFTC